MLAIYLLNGQENEEKYVSFHSKSNCCDWNSQHLRAFDRSVKVFQGPNDSQSSRRFFPQSTEFISKYMYYCCYSISPLEARRHNFQTYSPKAISSIDTAKFICLKFNLPLFSKNPCNPLSSLKWHHHMSPNSPNPKPRN